MARPSFITATSILSSFLALTNGQTTSNSADGLGPSAQPTASATVGTVIIDGTPTTFRPIFTVPASADEGADLIPNIKDPQAVNAQDVCPGYKASNVQEDENGLTATLTLAGESCNAYGNDIKELNLKVEYQAAKRLAINISPAHIDASNSSHYILPEELIPRPKPDSSYKDIDLEFGWDNEPSFWFTVTRHSTGDVIFTTENTKLVYEDQFIEFVSSLPKDYNLYGLGERIHGLRLNHNFSATIYAADAGDPIDRNIYGSHPFYLDTRYFETDEHGKRSLVKNSASPGEGHGGDHGGGSKYESYSHGVYLRNAHGQEVRLQPESITWRTLGGSIDLFFFDGPTQPEVTKQYQEAAIGLPAMQSYWGFGFHQCRWGYRNWTELRQVVDTFKSQNIPLETVWLDIDYMNQYRDFTNDPVTFPLDEGREFFDQLHKDNQHFIPIVDGAIYIPNPNNDSDAYDTYTRGNESGVFLMNPDGSQYIGSVWPGYTVFPDWQSGSAVSWWVNEAVQWHKEIPFDGMWIDMTEVASFCVGSCGSGNVTLNPVHPPFSLPGEEGNRIFDYPEGFNITNATEAASASAASSSQAAKTSSATTSTSTNYLRTTPTPGSRNVNHPPYVINNVHGDLAVHAVSPNATHHNGVEEYDVHNLWGHQTLNATYQALLSVFPGKRPFIIGRSTFAGSGKWSGHWGGDNASKWYYMYFSIPQALSFSLFGIPMFGVDTCGFNGNSDFELCSRWMQLSAFFPFYRNHNVLSAISQEPYIWSSVAEAARTAINIRYSLLPYMYTLFYKAHTTGSTVMRALAWEFPNDPQLAGVDNQFLLGPSLLITPVLEPQVDTVKGVFPGVIDGEVWYDWYTHEKIKAEAGVNTTIDAPLGHIPVFIRGGSVLPLQEPGYTTTQSRKNPWGLLIALSEDGDAKGELYVDDGESLEPSETLFVTFNAGDGKLGVGVKGGYKDRNTLGNLTIMGVDGCEGEIRLDGKSVSDEKVDCDEKTGVLQLSGLNDLTMGGAWSGNWTLSWE
ncbi:glycoside hydrolase family 31 protein [Zopfia rhizophila CBS 207.26]|uniref:alpha-glucosidase n=1 Tax=Zopfia rhizophila CBS 207.26 TaxID=1314779 RepID=A0A6A6DDY5_9PEZI|nr:glycoside hydrolase family 31 protein [Zopfia rhizophila CBS 207.26]